MSQQLSLNNLCCRLNALAASIASGGTLDIASIQTDLDAAEASIALLQAPNTEEIVGAGTAYSLTNTAAAVDLGTTDPAIVLGVAGTYLLMGRVQLEYTGATVVAETATVKLRRTNNTAADLGVAVVIDLPVATTLTHTYGIVPIAPVLVTTTNTDDAITLFGQVSATLGAGTIRVSAAGIVAIRLY